jgi:hypothetical protein
MAPLPAPAIWPFLIMIIVSNPLLIRRADQR